MELVAGQGRPEEERKRRRSEEREERGGREEGDARNGVCGR